MTNLAQLRALTESLPLGNYLNPVSCQSLTEVKMDSGTGLGFNLYNTKSISVAKWFSSKDSSFPSHMHLEREFIIVYEGTLILHRGEEEIILHSGDFSVNEPNVEHSASFPEDTWYIAITVPSSKDWPKQCPNQTAIGGSGADTF